MHQAIPILNDALAALDTIKEADIAYIKKLTNPPSAIKLVLEAVCVVLDVKPVKVSGHSARRTYSSFPIWPPSRSAKCEPMPACKAGGQPSE